MKPLVPILLMACMAHGALGQNYKSLRNDMISQQLMDRGIDHRPTLEAIGKVERHLFVPTQYQRQAYADSPLPIGYGQTISQPYIVAYMTQLLGLTSNDRVLEIGTGSGYQAAVLAEIAKEVYTIEIVRELGEQAKARLDSLGYDQITVIIGDGYSGLEAEAPFDAIMVTAAPDEVPPPLIGQLKDGGKIVIPVGPPEAVQTLMLIEKRGGKIIRKKMSTVRFVPFTRDQ